MFHLIKLVIKGVIAVVLLVVGWAGYQFVVSTGLVPGVDPETINSTGIVEKATGYGMTALVVVVVVLILWVWLRHGRNARPGATYWRD